MSLDQAIESLRLAQVNRAAEIEKQLSNLISAVLRHGMREPLPRELLLACEEGNRALHPVAIKPTIGKSFLKVTSGPPWEPPKRASVEHYEGCVEDILAGARVDFIVDFAGTDYAAVYSGVVLLDDDSHPLPWQDAIDLLAWRETMSPDKIPRICILTFQSGGSSSTRYIHPGDVVSAYRRHEEAK